MPTVLMGNRAPVDLRTKTTRIGGAETVTVFHVPDVDSHDHRMRNIAHDDGLWRQVSGANPAWVASDDAGLQEDLARHFNCPVKGMDEASDALAAVLESGARA